MLVADALKIKMLAVVLLCCWEKDYSRVTLYVIPFTQRFRGFIGAVDLGNVDLILMVMMELGPDGS